MNEPRLRTIVPDRPRNFWTCPHYKLEEWRTEDRQTADRFAQDNQGKRTAINARLDKLLDAHLDGALLLDEYKVKKNALMEQRAELQQKLANTARTGSH